MVERIDPARDGVKAGRVVGLLTAMLAVVGMLARQGTFYEGMTAMLALFEIDSGFFGIDPSTWIAVLFWGNAIFAAVARYAICYVIGSLIGVVYDWLERPSVAALIGMVLVVGFVDGLLASLDTRNLIIGGAYLLAWLCYVPIFLWLFDADGENREGPLRFGNSQR